MKVQFLWVSKAVYEEDSTPICKLLDVNALCLRPFAVKFINTRVPVDILWKGRMVSDSIIRTTDCT